VKLPGRAWLEFGVVSNQRHSTIRQTAIFDPGGLFGLVYWYALCPLHCLIFWGMLRALARAAENERSERLATRQVVDPTV